MILLGRGCTQEDSGVREILLFQEFILWLQRCASWNWHHCYESLLCLFVCWPTLVGKGDLSSPIGDQNPRLLPWKCRILTTGPPGKSRVCVYVFWWKPLVLYFLFHLWILFLWPLHLFGLYQQPSGGDRLSSWVGLACTVRTEGCAMKHPGTSHFIHIFA